MLRPYATPYSSSTYAYGLESLVPFGRTDWSKYGLLSVGKRHSVKGTLIG